MWRAPALLLTAVLVVGACGGSPSPSASGPAGTVTPGRSDAPPLVVPNLSQVALVPDRAVRTHVGASGGTLEVVDASGTTYRLEIPAGALIAEQELLAVPVTSIDGLPAALRARGGIHLLPEGLALRRAATLTITAPATPDRSAVAFGYRGDRDQPHRYPATTDASTVTLEIVHFSGYGLLEATDAATTAAELGLLIPWEPPDGAADRALAEIAAAIDVADDDRSQRVNDALRRWLQDGLAQLSATFGAVTTWNDGPFFDQGVRLRSELELWDYVTKLVTLRGVTVEPALDTRSVEIAVAAAAHGVAVANDRCGESAPAIVAHLRIPDIANWLAWAAERGISERDPYLGAAFVADNLCAQVQFMADAGVSFPADIQPGQSGTLVVAAGLQVIGSAEVHAVGAYDVTVTPVGTDPGGVVIETTDLAGAWAHTFTWAAAATGLRLDIEACLPAPLDTVCAARPVTRGVAPTPAPTLVATAGCLQYDVGLDGQIYSESDKDGVSQTAARGAVSALPEHAFVINAFDGGDASATTTGAYLVDASAAGAGSFPLTVVFTGRVQDPFGGQATVRVTVGDVTKAFTSPLTDRTGADVGLGTLEFPVSVRNGDLLQVRVQVTVVSAGAGSSTTLTGGIHFLGRPDNVFLGQPGCV